MRVHSKKQQSEITISLSAFGYLKAAGRVMLTPAYLSHTMGPLWHDIVWVDMGPHGMRPFISSTHYNADITGVLSSEFA